MNQSTNIHRSLWTIQYTTKPVYLYGTRTEAELYCIKNNISTWTLLEVKNLIDLSSSSSSKPVDADVVAAPSSSSPVPDPIDIMTPQIKDNYFSSEKKRKRNKK